MEVDPTSTMSVDLKEAFEQVSNYSTSKIKNTSFHPNECVEIYHSDGTIYRFECAFVRKLWVRNNKYIAVFTEHQGNHVFAYDDLQSDGYFVPVRFYRKKILKIKKLEI